MDYTKCATFQNFLQKYPVIIPKDLLVFINDIMIIESKQDVQYSEGVLKQHKLVDLRRIAGTFKIKQHYKMDKKQIIQAILQKQNSLSDTSSNSSGSDTELKIQPKKEEITQPIQKEENTQPVQKEENFIVYESEKTETEEEQNTETEEENNTPETTENTEDFEKYKQEYVGGIQDIQLLQNIIQYMDNLPHSFFGQKKRSQIKYQYETDLQLLLSKPKKSTRQPPKKKDAVCNNSDDSDNSTKRTKHVYTKSETEQLLTPEEIAILETVATTSSAKHKRTNLHAKKRRLKMKLNNEQKQSSEEESNESS